MVELVPVGGNVAVCAENQAVPSIRVKRVTSGIVKGWYSGLCGEII
jgi:hypothetical protein